MANSKITDLTGITGTDLATGDLIPVVDVSDSTAAATGTNKKTTLADIKTAIGAGLPHLFVAANDAPAAMKLRADYVCDGTADQADINAALAALPTNGGIVELSEGTFSVSAQILIDRHSTIIRGQGIDATKIVSTTASFDIIRIGTRQTSGIMRNNARLEYLTVTSAGGAATNSCIFIDGGGRGTGCNNVRTNEGGYGMRLKDLDRCLFLDTDNNNVRTAGILCETGLENTWGTVQFINPSMALSDANSKCWVWDTAAEQSSPNRFDRIGIYNALFFSTTGVTGTKGLVMNVGATAMVVANSLFESPLSAHIELNDETQITLLACSMIQNGATKTTNGISLNTDNHQVTIISCRFQQCTNLINGVSGFSQITLLGHSTNQGNITNLWAGSFGFRSGTDVLFAGDDVLVLGGDNERFNKIQGTYHYFKETASAPDTASGKSALYVRSSDGKLIYKDETGTENEVAFV